MNDRINDASAAFIADEKLIENSHSRVCGNTVPTGYKQTEVGIIPIDWSVCLIGAHAAVKTGPFGSSLHEKDYVSDGTPIITVEHLVSSGISQHNLPMVSDEDRERLKAYKLRAGDIVFSRVGSIDRNALVTSIEAGWLFSGRLLRLRLRPESQNPAYWSHHFHSTPFKKRVVEVAVGQTMPSLNTNILKNISVVLPTSRAEQTAIANVLSDVDALISELEKLIAKKQAIKTATMQQLLTGRTRLPQFSLNSDGSLKGTKNTELGEIPEDWEIVTLGDICAFAKGAGLSKSEMDENATYPCIHYGQLFTGYGPLIGTVKSATENYRPNSVLSESNDILMPTSDVTPNGLATASCIKQDGVILGGDILVIRSKPRVLDGIFFSYLICIIRDRVMQLVTGSSVYQLFGSEMAKLLIARPASEEQEAIADVLCEMDDEIEALKQRLDKTRQLKQGMMQELLTGKTRLV
ncbi:restriction endonuclease subunit S [Methylophaga sp.]|uniref:restriction endonuclease subunit S n=1 Tax=Methylophaga sp. TaxID=2024840 RepID=UPI003A8CB830